MKRMKIQTMDTWQNITLVSRVGVAASFPVDTMENNPDGFPTLPKIFFWAEVTSHAFMPI